MSHDLRMRVWRGDATGGDFASFTVPVEEGEVVLDAIHRLQAEQAPDLAVRWNCKAGKCGSCSAEVNGQPRLMCMTRLSSYEPTETITVTPMRTFPVIRDHDDNKPAFAGPRMFIRYAELDMHPLDTLDRRQMAQADEGLGYCNITKCCTEVCPEGIHITDNGIIPLKERVVDTKYDPVFLGLRIGRRKDRRPVGPAGGNGASPIKRPGSRVDAAMTAASGTPTRSGRRPSPLRRRSRPGRAVP